MLGYTKPPTSRDSWGYVEISKVTSQEMLKDHFTFQGYIFGIHKFTCQKVCSIVRD